MGCSACAREERPSHPPCPARNCPSEIFLVAWNIFRCAIYMLCCYQVIRKTILVSGQVMPLCLLVQGGLSKIYCNFTWGYRNIYNRKVSVVIVKSSIVKHLFIYLSSLKSLSLMWIFLKVFMWSSYTSFWSSVWAFISLNFGSRTREATKEDGKILKPWNVYFLFLLTMNHVHSLSEYSTQINANFYILVGIQQFKKTRMYLER